MTDESSSQQEWTTSDIEAVAADMSGADHVVALTGAGVSTASGIPDFRSEGGIWDKYDPEQFRYGRFQADPEGFWRERVEMHAAVYGEDTMPNVAHETLATLEAAGVLDGLVTQNIDGLHRRAGSQSVVELHGTADRVVCDDCGWRTDAGPVYQRVRDGDLPPRCEHCGGVLKPDVVLFGESLPEGLLQQAQRHAREADVFLAVGSSLRVEPAASLPRLAQRDGTLVVVNFDPTPVSGSAEYDIRGDVTDVLPAIAGALGVDVRSGCR